MSDERWWLRGAGRADVGTVREYNEDDFQFVGPMNLAVVCDGMGGNCGGGPAAKTAAWTVVERYGRGESGEPQQGMIAALEAAHARVGRVPLPGIGTAVVALHLVGRQVVIGHVGTCRVDRVRGGQWGRLTGDHSLAAELHARGVELSPQDAERFALVTTQTLGLASHPPRIETVLDVAAPGDLYLLTTDGLWSALAEDAIARLVHRSEGMVASERPRAVVDALMGEALARGASDNVTVCAVVVDVGGAPDDRCGRTSEPTVPWLYAPEGVLAERPERWRGMGDDPIAWYSEIHGAVMGDDD